MKRIKNLFASLLLGALGCAEPFGSELSETTALPPPSGATLIDAEAAFSCDFEIDPNFPLDQIPPVIERDRMFMSAKPGMVHGKHLPLRIDLQTGRFFSGGRYLFRSVKEATSYKKFVEEDYVLDGVQFLDRPEFFSSDCHAWSAIAAYELGDIESDHIVMRTERWSVPPGNHRDLLKSRVPLLLDAAKARGLTGMWLLYSHKERLVELVYMDGRIAEPLPDELDFASLFALEYSAPLGAAFDDQNWTRVLDRTHFLLSIWFPFVPGDQGEPSVWPNSPPLPEPYCSDEVCEVSRGEDHASCPQDCPPHCGDAVCQEEEGEDTKNCPGDCRL